MNQAEIGLVDLNLLFSFEYKYNNFISSNRKDGKCIVSLLKSHKLATIRRVGARQMVRSERIKT
jgi:hypothetical protein